MNYKKNYHSNTGFRDLLFNILLVFVFLFFISFVLIAPVKKEADISIKAEYIITLTWDDAINDDIDIWLADPIGNILFFRNQDNGFMHLDRDDLGESNDTIIMPDGSTTVIKLNQEIISIRGFISGEWILNIHMYRKIYSEPVQVSVKVEKLNPTVKTIVYKEYLMDIAWEEITVARLIMTANGEIIDMNDLPKSLIQSFLTESDRASATGDYSNVGDFY